MIKLSKKNNIQCSFCGCVVPISGTVCTQCGAPLPINDKKHMKKTIMDIHFSDDPHFNQDIWIGFYRHCFNIGVELARIFNGGSEIDIDDEKVAYLCRISLLGNMVRENTANQEADSLYYKKIHDMVNDITSMKGYNSFTHLGQYSYDWTAKCDPVIIGFMYGSDGTVCNARLGDMFYCVLLGFYRALESVQEIALLVSDITDDIFCERYVYKFKHTEIPIWCNEKAHNLFASAVFIDWNKSPVKFKNNILCNQKIMKKFLKDYDCNLKYQLNEEDIKNFNPKSSTIMGIMQMQRLIRIYCYDKACSLLCQENKIYPKCEISECKNWIHDNLLLDDIIMNI